MISITKDLTFFDRVRFFTEYVDPHWGSETEKPVWWPNDIPFISPHQGSKIYIIYFFLMRFVVNKSIAPKPA